MLHWRYSRRSELIEAYEGRAVVSAICWLVDVTLLLLTMDGVRRLVAALMLHQQGAPRQFLFSLLPSTIRVIDWKKK